MSVSGAPRKHGNLVCARQKERQCGSLVSFDSNHRRTAARRGRARRRLQSALTNRKLKVDVLETILNNFAVVTRTLLVIRDFLIARRVCKLTYHNGSERSKRMVRGYVLRACATRSHQRTYEDSLLALCALRGSGRWAASSPDACVRAGAVRTRSGVGALSQEGSGVGALNML